VADVDIQLGFSYGLQLDLSRLRDFSPP